MLHADRFDSLIQYWAGALCVNRAASVAGKSAEILIIDWLLIKAVCDQESGMNPLAVSECGAMGLMQLMPATAEELNITAPFDVDSNLRGGISYLREQYRRFPEIPDDLERWRFALAAYNAGRGTINHAIQHEIIDHGKAGGTWQQWCNVVDELPEIQSRDNAKQTTDYVEKIISNWLGMKIKTQ